MNIAAEFQAAMPEPHVILGVRLLPLSLGRYRLLKRFDSPFVSEEQIELPMNKIAGELLFALIVCGLTCAEFKALIDSGEIKTECDRFNENFRKYVQATEGFDIFAVIQQFKNYLKEATDVPWHILPLQSSQSGGASHWSHGMEMILRSQIGWTLEEINEEPLSKAMCDYWKFLESEGAVRLVSHEDFEIMESFGDENARILAEFEEAIKKGRK